MTVSKLSIHSLHSLHSSSFIVEEVNTFFVLCSLSMFSLTETIEWLLWLSEQSIVCCLLIQTQLTLHSNVLKVLMRGTHFFCSRSFSTHFLFHFSHFVFNFELTNRRRCLGSSTMTPARLRSVAEYLPKLNQSLSTIFLSLDQSLGNYLHTQPKSLNGIWTTQPLHTTVILIIA